MSTTPNPAEQSEESEQPLTPNPAEQSEQPLTPNPIAPIASFNTISMENLAGLPPKLSNPNSSNLDLSEDNEELVSVEESRTNLPIYKQSGFKAAVIGTSFLLGVGGVFSLMFPKEEQVALKPITPDKAEKAPVAEFAPDPRFGVISSKLAMKQQEDALIAATIAQKEAADKAAKAAQPAATQPTATQPATAQPAAQTEIAAQPQTVINATPQPDPVYQPPTPIVRRSRPTAEPRPVPIQSKPVQPVAIARAQPQPTRVVRVASTKVAQIQPVKPSIDRTIKAKPIEVAQIPTPQPQRTVKVKRDRIEIAQAVTPSPLTKVVRKPVPQMTQVVAKAQPQIVPQAPIVTPQQPNPQVPTVTPQQPKTVDEATIAANWNAANDNAVGLWGQTSRISTAIAASAANATPASSNGVALQANSEDGVLAAVAVVGQQVKGKTIIPLQAVVSNKLPQPIAIALSEPVMDDRGNVLLKSGTQVMTEVAVLDNGLLQVVSAKVSVDGKVLELPKQSLILQSSNRSLLIAESKDFGQTGGGFGQDLLTIGGGALQGIGKNLIASQTQNIIAGGTVLQTSNSSQPNIAGAALDGGLSPILAQWAERNRATLNQTPNPNAKIWYLPTGTELNLIVAQPFNL
jgi:hypothetical protein